MTDSRPESRSWAELVQTIDHERKNLPWDPTKTQPVQRVGMYERKKAEREYDLIASAYRNPERQDMAVTAKLDKETAKLRQVKEATESTFNIVSHQGPPRRIESMITAQKTKGMPPRPYNFVTNLTVEDHQNAPLLFDEAYTNARAGKPKEIRSAVGKHNRDFSIVNNEFYEHHDSKKKAEYQKFKDHTLEKYWATHDYDPVRGKFYNAEKEERFREQRQILSQVHGMSKSLRVAPSIQYSEGSCYDIVNHAIHDDGKCTTSDAVADRSLHRMKRVEKEKQAREEGEVRHSAEDQRRLARVSYKRWEEGIDRGYDFIKNAVAPVDQPMPLPTRPTTMWARLQTTAEMNADNGRNGLSGANTANSVRGSTAAPAAQTTGRIRNLSGVGPQYAELRVNLPTRDTFPDSPGTYMSTDAGFTGRNSSYSPGPAAPQQQQVQSVRLKPMTAAADSSAAQNGGFNGSARGSRAATANPTSGANREGVRSRVGAVPSLDLTKAEAPEPVRYVEPAHGPMGLSVAMVRTGGLGGYRE